MFIFFSRKVLIYSARNESIGQMLVVVLYSGDGSRGSVLSLLCHWAAKLALSAKASANAFSSRFVPALSASSVAFSSIRDSNSGSNIFLVVSS